jgi:hypothetical protein
VRLVGIGEDGPLAGSRVELAETVDDEWPDEVVWPDAAGQSHVYRHAGLLKSRGGPCDGLYEFVRSLDASG